MNHDNVINIPMSPLKKTSIVSSRTIRRMRDAGIDASKVAQRLAELLNKEAFKLDLKQLLMLKYFHAVAPAGTKIICRLPLPSETLEEQNKRPFTLTEIEMLEKEYETLRESPYRQTFKLSSTPYLKMSQEQEEKMAARSLGKSHWPVDMENNNES